MVECREICRNAKQHLPGEKSTVDFKRPEGRGCEKDMGYTKKALGYIILSIYKRECLFGGTICQAEKKKN